MQGKTNGTGVAARQIFKMRLKLATELWRWKVRGVHCFHCHGIVVAPSNLGQPGVTLRPGDVQQKLQEALERIRSLDRIRFFLAPFPDESRILKGRIQRNNGWTYEMQSSNNPPVVFGGSTFVQM